MSSGKGNAGYGLSDISSSSDNDEEYSPDKLLRPMSMRGPQRLTDDPSAPGVPGTSGTVSTVQQDSRSSEDIVTSNLEFVRKTIETFTDINFKCQYPFSFLESLDSLRIKLDYFYKLLGSSDSTSESSAQTYDTRVYNVHIKIANFYAYIILEYLKFLRRARQSKETRHIAIKTRDLIKQIGTADDAAKKIQFRSARENSESHYCYLVPLHISNDAIINQFKKSLKKRKKSKKLCSIARIVGIEIYENRFQDSNVVFLINTSSYKTPDSESNSESTEEKSLSKDKKPKKAKKKSSGAKKVSEKSDQTSNMGQALGSISKEPDSVRNEKDISENSEVISEIEEAQDWISIEPDSVPNEIELAEKGELTSDVGQVQDSLSVDSDYVPIKKEFELTSDMVKGQDSVSKEPDSVPIEKEFAEKSQLTSDIGQVQDSISVESDYVPLEKEFELTSDMVKVQDSISKEPDSVPIEIKLVEKCQLTSDIREVRNSISVEPDNLPIEKKNAEKSQLTSDIVQVQDSITKETDSVPIEKRVAEKSELTSDMLQMQDLISKEPDSVPIEMELAEKSQITSDIGQVQDFKSVEPNYVSIEKTVAEKSELTSDMVQVQDSISKETDSVPIEKKVAEKSELTSDMLQMQDLISKEPDSVPIEMELAEKSQITSDIGQVQDSISKETDSVPIEMKLAEKSLLTSDIGQVQDSISVEPDYVKIEKEVAEKCELTSDMVQVQDSISKKTDFVPIEKQFAEKIQLTSDIEQVQDSISVEPDYVPIEKEVSEKNELTSDMVEVQNSISKEPGSVPIEKEFAEKSLLTSDIGQVQNSISVEPEYVPIENKFGEKSQITSDIGQVQDSISVEPDYEPNETQLAEKSEITSEMGQVQDLISNERIEISTEESNESMETKVLKISNYFSNYNLSSILFLELSNYEISEKVEQLVEGQSMDIMKLADFSIIKIIILINTLQFSIKNFEIEYSVGALESLKDCLKILHHINKFSEMMKNELANKKNNEFKECFLPVLKMCQSNLLALILSQSAAFVNAAALQSDDNEALTYSEFLQLVEIFGTAEQINGKLQYRNDDVYTELAKQACIVTPLSNIRSSNEDIIEYVTSIRQSKGEIVMKQVNITVHNLKLPSPFGPPKCTEFDYLHINIEQLKKLLELQCKIYVSSCDPSKFHRETDDLREFCITLKAFEKFEDSKLRNGSFVHSFLNTIDNILSHHVLRILVSQFYSFIFHILLEQYSKSHVLENKSDAKYFRRIILNILPNLCPIYQIPEKLCFRNDEFFMRYMNAVFNCRGLVINYTSQQLCGSISRVLRENKLYFDTFHKKYLSTPIGFRKQIAILEKKISFNLENFYIIIQEQGSKNFVHFRELTNEVLQAKLG